ncbi:MAG: hypothetical protein KatS3mg119_0066 [Rhodothalassiaceae bacterium]|nr:MAG: hypothetical protein KatS3mg119_0066 [Rhodothalassiaceae bacterium]
MARDRRVTCANHDRYGDITHIGNPHDWGIVTKDEAIYHIENDIYRCYVQAPGTSPTYIEVVNGPTGKYLRTEPDGDPRNNLDNLPECH